MVSEADLARWCRSAAGRWKHERYRAARAVALAVRDRAAFGRACERRAAIARWERELRARADEVERRMCEIDHAERR